MRGAPRARLASGRLLPRVRVGGPPLGGHLLEEVYEATPAASIRQRAVVVGLRQGEGMRSAAVRDHLPVDVRGSSQLVLEGEDGLIRNHRVGPAGQDQNGPL